MKSLKKMWQLHSLRRNALIYLNTFASCALTALWQQTNGFNGLVLSAPTSSHSLSRHTRNSPLMCCTLYPPRSKQLMCKFCQRFETDIDEIIGWLVCLLEVSSSRRFLKRCEIGDVEKSRGYTIHLLDALKRGIYVRILQQLLNASSYSTSNKNWPFFEHQRRTDVHLC